jgi:2-methylcitrate dehydratase PrpD
VLRSRARSDDRHDLDDFGMNWEILGNGFKLYASCRATHASTEAAARLTDAVRGRTVDRIHVRTHGHALVTAGKMNPQTPLEGKFSVPFCVALGLTGHRLAPADFSAAMLADPAIADLVPRISVEPVVGQPPYEAHVDVYLQDGDHLHADTEILKGHPNNPLSWQDLQDKFGGLIAPVLGTRTAEDLFGVARQIDRRGALAEVMAIVGPRA